MELKFSKSELKALVDLALMSDWMMTAHEVEDDERKDDHLKLLQKIYGFAHKNGMTKEIELMEDIKEYCPNAEWEDSSTARQFIDEFEEKTFWDELVERLSERDLNRKLKGKKAESFQQHMEIFEEFSSKYFAEFSQNELENLEVVEKSKKK